MFVTFIRAIVELGGQMRLWFGGIRAGMTDLAHHSSRHYFYGNA